MAFLKSRRSDSVPSLPPISPNGQLEQTNLNNILVITKNDLDRINGHLNKRRNEENSNQEEIQRKRDLHEKSKALTRNWNNTIEGSRRHKLQQKAVREEKLEKERQIVDVEFAKVMAVERKKALEEAKLKQYHETDKVKSFHSALKLSEVLKEREAQIELKKLIDQIKLEQENELTEKFSKMQAEKDKKEYLKDQQKAEEAAKLTEFLYKQMQMNEEKAERAKEQVYRDAENIEQLNENFRIEKEKLAKVHKKKQIDLREEYDRTLVNKHRNKEAEQMIDEEENEEIRTYAAAKRKMAIMKRQKELAMIKEKEERQERINAQIGLVLKEKDTDEDFRIAKTVAKREAKEYNDELVKNLKWQQQQHQIDLFRKETMQRKAEEAKERQREDVEFMKKKMETDQLYQMYEREKMRQRGKEIAQISKANTKIDKELKDKEKKNRMLEKEYIAKEMDMMRMEDMQFEEYATNVIDYMDKHGRNTFPMKKCVYDKLNKPYRGPETEAQLIKKHQNDVKTKKNLGFGI